MVKDIRAPTVPDYAFQQNSTEVGRGSIDWDRLLPAAYAAGVHHFFVEQEPPFTMDRFRALEISYDFLSRR